MREKSKKVKLMREEIENVDVMNPQIQNVKSVGVVSRSFKPMKTPLKFYLKACVLAFCVIFVSCKPTENEETGDDFNIWVLNEGVWSMGNGSITAYNTFTYEKEADMYGAANNGRQLGDLPNDILLYGSKVYVVVSTANLIDVIDSKTGVSIKQIPVTTGSTASTPRQIASHNGKVYVCCFDGSVVKIDTASLLIEAVAKAGRNPDGICVANNKLYVSNSGGLDYPNCDSTISVFDLGTFTEIKKIAVRINPGQMKADKNGNIYLISNEIWDWGAYQKLSSSCLQRINSTTDQVEVLFDEITGFDIYNDYLYFYIYDYVSAIYKIYDLLQNKVINTNFISGATLQVPYGINVNPKNGDVYLFDALDYTSTGDVYCFDKNGTKKFQFEAGIVPKKAVFK